MRTLARMPREKNEQAAFSDRLRSALQKAGVSESPAELVKLLARFGGEPVSQQAISGWLNGRAMPRQANLRALAKMLSVEPQYLQYGEDGKRVRDQRAEYKINPLDQLAVTAYLALPMSQRKAVRSVIEEFAKSRETSGKSGKRGG
jgi:transcriptional regulator with XRE-family HTH domain